MRAARAARLFFRTRPIKFLIYGVVVAVAVVDAKAPYCLALKLPQETNHVTNQNHDWLMMRKNYLRQALHAFWC